MYAFKAPMALAFISVRKAQVIEVRFIATTW